MRSRAVRALVALVALVAGDDAPRKPPLLRQHGARDLHAGGEDLPSLPAVPPLGERTRMRWTPPADAPCPEGGVTELQLFLPAAWTRRAPGAGGWPVLVFLHGAGDGEWATMNSQSLPRLLASDQSTAFDPDPTWRLRWEGREYADAAFAAEWPFITLMPVGWTPDGAYGRRGWSAARLDRVRALALAAAAAYGGDPSRVSLAGQSAGGAGAWSFALRHPTFLAALVPICGHLADASPAAARRLARLPIWVFHAADDVAMPVELSDEAVAALNAGDARASAGARAVRYTRYEHAPGPPDPRYADMTGHASYDLAVRDPELAAWLLAQRNPRPPALEAAAAAPGADARSAAARAQPWGWGGAL